MPYRGLLSLLAFLTGCWTTAPSAQTTYKCTSKDGKTSYSNSPCPGSAAVMSAPKPRILDVNTMTQAQADIASDCADALVIQENGLVEDTQRERALFDRHCGAFGYKVPLSAGTREFNRRHSRQLIDRLRERFENVPSFPTLYSGGVRYPPTFDTVESAMQKDGVLR